MKNLVERAVIISSEDLIGPESIQVDLREKRRVKRDRNPHIDLKTYGSVREAAASLGMTAPTFVRIYREIVIFLLS